MDSERVKELEAALELEKEERARAEEAYRKLQADVLTVASVPPAALLTGPPSRAPSAGPPALTGPPSRAPSAAPPAKAASEAPPAKVASEHPAKRSVAPALIINAPAEVSIVVEQMLQRIEGLREMLASASVELSQLHADEVALHKKRTRVLSDACALLARAVGTTGQAPPPIPSAALEARFSIAPIVDISEVADLIESLRPPRAPKVE